MDSNQLSVHFLIKNEHVLDENVGVVCYGDVDHPVPGQIDHRVS